MHRLLAIIATVCASALVAAPAGAGDREDQSIAKKATLKASDLPDDWDSTPADVTDEIQLPECEDIDRATRRADRQPNAKSPGFSDPSDPVGIVRAENTTYLFSSKKAARRYVAVFTTDKAEDCFLAVGEAVAESQVPGADVSVEELDLDGLGDGGVGLTIVVDGVTENDEPVELYADLWFVRVGRGVIALVAQGSGEQLDLGPDLLELVVGRLERAL